MINASNTRNKLCINYFLYILVVFFGVLIMSGCSGGSGDGGPDPEPATAPTMPAELAGQAVSSSQINLSWNDNSNNETSFRIQRDSGSGFVDLVTVPANTTSYDDIGLSSSTAYTYRVCAYNGTGTSSYSNEAVATTESEETITCAPLPGEDIYYVDGAGLCGSCDDTRTKEANSILTPWCTIQHAVDAAAPGDTIYVRQGTYREEVTLHVSGTQELPIILKAFPGEDVVLEGSVPLNGFSPCASAESCGGNANWQQIYHAPLPPDVAAMPHPLIANLHQNDEMLWVAQEPDQPDPFFMDVIDNFYTVACANVTTTSITDTAVLNQTDPHAWDSAYVLVWVSQNRVNVRKINSFIPASNRITFDATNTPPYTDRDERYSLYNSINLIDQPGEYCIKENPDSSLTLYMWPRQGVNNISISVLDFGIDINRQSHVMIDGFTVQRYSSTDLVGGVGIGTITRNATVTGITVKNNTIRHNRKDVDGYGGIFLDRCTDCLVENNQLDENAKHYGIFVMNPLRTTVRNNTITRPGRTALTYYGADYSQFIGNTISGCKGSHTNTIAIYLGSDNILVANNKVSESYGGMTIENSSNITIYNNLFDASGEGATFNEWAGTSGGTIAMLHNTFVNNSRNASLNIGSYGANYIVKNNILDGYCPKTQTIWTHNLYTGLQYCQDDEYDWELEEGGIIEFDPEILFTDPGHFVYSLVTGSPAINAGTDISTYLPVAAFPDFGFNVDLAGNPRIQGGTPDIGAYEYHQ